MWCTSNIFFLHGSNWMLFTKNAQMFLKTYTIPCKAFFSPPSTRFVCFPTSVWYSFLSLYTPHNISSGTLHVAHFPLPHPLASFFPPFFSVSDVSVHPVIISYRTFNCPPACHVCVSVAPASCSSSLHACLMPVGSALWMLRVLLCVSRTHSLWLCQLCCEDSFTHIEVSSSDGNLISKGPVLTTAFAVTGHRRTSAIRRACWLLSYGITTTVKQQKKMEMKRWRQTQRRALPWWCSQRHTHSENDTNQSSLSLKKHWMFFLLMTNLLTPNSLMKKKNSLKLLPQHAYDEKLCLIGVFLSLDSINIYDAYMFYLYIIDTEYFIARHITACWKMMNAPGAFVRYWLYLLFVHVRL